MCIRDREYLRERANTKRENTTRMNLDDAIKVIVERDGSNAYRSPVSIINTLEKHIHDTAVDKGLSATKENFIHQGTH